MKQIAVFLLAFLLCAPAMAADEVVTDSFGASFANQGHPALGDETLESPAMIEPAAGEEDDTAAQAVDDAEDEAAVAPEDAPVDVPAE